MRKLSRSSKRDRTYEPDLVGMAEAVGNRPSATFVLQPDHRPGLKVPLSFLAEEPSGNADVKTLVENVGDVCGIEHCVAQHTSLNSLEASNKGVGFPFAFFDRHNQRRHYSPLAVGPDYSIKAGS